MKHTLALVTAATMTVEDKDSPLLVSAFRDLNLDARIVSWDEQTDWEQFSLVLIRSPWNYHEQREEFLTWAQNVQQKTRLLNCFETLSWNSHKSYLLELQTLGIPILPTQIRRQGSAIADLPLPSGEIIVKPAIGIGSSGIMRAQHDAPMLLNHLQDLLQAGDVLVQPFAPSVLTAGEISLVFIGGTYSHSVRKMPAPNDFRVQSQHGGTVIRDEPTTDEFHVATQAIGAAGSSIPYARVDLINWKAGPVVMELEAIEPDLYLRFDPSSPARFATYLKSFLPPSNE